MAELLIDSGADVNLGSKASGGAAHSSGGAAASYSSPALLLGLRHTLGCTVLARCGCIPKAHAQSHPGPSLPCPTSQDFASPLHQAAGSGMLQVLRLLLRKGADINAADEVGALLGLLPAHSSLC